MVRYFIGAATVPIQENPFEKESNRNTNTTNRTASAITIKAYVATVVYFLFHFIFKSSLL